MTNIKNNNKILFIPGWLDTGARHGYQNSLDIWTKSVNINRDFEVDYIIAHSAGSLVALYNWNIYKNFKIILINPVISRKNIFKRWHNFLTHEGISDSFRKSIRPLSVVLSLYKIIKLFKVSALDIINTIPKENLLIIYGDDDIYLFDKAIANNLKQKGYQVEEVKGDGHKYGENIEKKIIDLDF